jgi:hypothetical protein
MGPQSRGSFNFGNLGISGLPLGSSRKKWHLGDGTVAKHRVYYKGEGGGESPNLGYGESFEFVFGRGLSVHQKCSNYALTNLFGLYMSMWVIELFFILPSLHLEALTRLSTPKVLRVKERAPTPCPSVVFTFKLAVESTKEFGGASPLTTYLIEAQRKVKTF